MKLLLALFFLSGPKFSHGQVIPALPEPRVVMVGPTGSGKSSLGNALLGCDPRNSSCMFPVCSDLGSCTKNTAYGWGPYLGDGATFLIVDTPGFGDSDNDDEILIEEMMDVLANTITKTDTILLVLKGTYTRFDAPLQGMLKRMTVMFGESWWDFLVVGVSFWKYDQDSIDDRQELCNDPAYPEFCKDEEWYAESINSELQEKFGLTRNVSFVFIDSYSQITSNKDDETQQVHWKDQTKALWDITSNVGDDFQFKTIDDILRENAEQRKEIKWLNDVITNNISSLFSRVGNNSEKISHLDTEVLDIDKNVDHNSDDISTIQREAVMNKVELDKKIADNWENISSNFDQIVINSEQIYNNSDIIADNSVMIADNSDIISDNGNQIEVNSLQIKTNTDNIASNTHSREHPAVIAQCGYNGFNVVSSGTILYDSLTEDVTTDGSRLSIATGMYKVRTPGVYQVTFSGYVFNGAAIYLYRNGDWLEETYFGNTDVDSDGSSRTILLHLCAEETIELRKSAVAKAARLLFCTHLVEEKKC